MLEHPHCAHIYIRSMFMLKATQNVSLSQKLQQVKKLKISDLEIEKIVLLTRKTISVVNLNLKIYLRKN